MTLDRYADLFDDLDAVADRLDGIHESLTPSAYSSPVVELAGR